MIQMLGPHWAFWLLELGIIVVAVGIAALNAFHDRPDPKRLWRWSHREDAWIEDEVLAPIPRTDNLLENRRYR